MFTIAMELFGDSQSKRVIESKLTPPYLSRGCIALDIPDGDRDCRSFAVPSGRRSWPSSLLSYSVDECVQSIFLVDLLSVYPLDVVMCFVNFTCRRRPLFMLCPSDQR